MHKDLIGAYVQFQMPMSYPEPSIGYVMSIEYDQSDVGYMSYMGRKIVVASVNAHPQIYLTVINVYNSRHGIWQKEKHDDSEWFIVKNTIPLSSCRILDLFEIVYLKLEIEGRLDDQIST